jgi:hypothetical protein
MAPQTIDHFLKMSVEASFIKEFYYGRIKISLYKLARSN